MIHVSFVLEVHKNNLQKLLIILIGVLWYNIHEFLISLISHFPSDWYKMFLMYLCIKRCEHRIV